MFVIVNNKRFPAELLSTPEEISTGMMGRNSLEGCLVFDVGMGSHSFWMKNCLIALDIVFVLKNKISAIHLNCEPAGKKLNPIRYTGIGDHVIEFPAGTAKEWKIGDRVNLI